MIDRRGAMHRALLLLPFASRLKPRAYLISPGKSFEPKSRFTA